MENAMKSKSKPLLALLSLSLVATVMPGNPLLRGAQAADRMALVSAAAPPQEGQASEALKQGRALLKRGKADQALARLQSALTLFKAANNAKGVAAANDALGDLYLRQGQYAVAVKYYQDAHDAYAQAGGGEVVSVGM